MASGNAPQYSDRVRVSYLDSPHSRIQAGDADLPFLPRLRVGAQVDANLGGVVRFRPLIDTACTYIPNIPSPAGAAAL
ncbi:MAG: hypothetical protein KY475_12405 [Planctomycetes bacterium]|nr:hypothetical protein [Planctomycetota bacterium]